MIVRPVTPDDLPALLELIRGTPSSRLTSLPDNEAHLQQRIEIAQKSFRRELEGPGTDYLFVMENADGRLIGTSAIRDRIGLREPWYNYRLGLTVSASQMLDIHREIPTLFLVNDLTGSAELCSLLLHPDFRRSVHGKLLSKARLLFMAEHRDAFSHHVIAEMRGITDEQGRSPFWDGLGRHFFKMDFLQADYLVGMGRKAFIAELMPKFPLYLCFLSEPARQAIGKAHPLTEPAMRMLQEEGFVHQSYIDIFDGGAVFEADIEWIRAVNEAQCYVLATGTPGDDASTYLIYNRRDTACRIVLGKARVAAGSLVIEPQLAKRLEMSPGDSVRAVLLTPKPRG